MPMRWRWPPENSAGLRRSAVRGQPDLVDERGGPVRAVTAARTPRSRNGSATMSLRGQVRVQRAVRVLEHHLDAGAHGRSCVLGQRPRCRHRRGRCRPDVGCSSRTTDLANVDLPQPDSPTTARQVPLSTEGSRRRRLGTRSLPATGYSTTRSSTRSSGSVMAGTSMPGGVAVQARGIGVEESFGCRRSVGCRRALRRCHPRRSGRLSSRRSDRDISRATPRSWVISSMATPVRSCSSSSRSRMLA